MLILNTDSDPGPVTQLKAGADQLPYIIALTLIALTFSNICSASVFIDASKISNTRYEQLSSFRLIFLFKWTGEQEKGNIVQDSRLDTIFFAKQVPLMHLSYTLDISGEFWSVLRIRLHFIRILIQKVLDPDPEAQNASFSSTIYSNHLSYWYQFKLFCFEL